MEKYILNEIKEREEKYKLIMQTNIENQRAELNSMNKKDKYYFMIYLDRFHIKRNNLEKQIQKEKSLIDHMKSIL
jgi:hypothetical protein